MDITSSPDYEALFLQEIERRCPHYRRIKTPTRASFGGYTQGSCFHLRCLHLRQLCHGLVWKLGLSSRFRVYDLATFDSFIFRSVIFLSTKNARTKACLSNDKCGLEIKKRMEFLIDGVFSHDSTMVTVLLKTRVESWDIKAVCVKSFNSPKQRLWPARAKFSLQDRKRKREHACSLDA